MFPELDLFSKITHVYSSGLKRGENSHNFFQGQSDISVFVQPLSAHDTPDLRDAPRTPARTLLLWVMDHKAFSVVDSRQK